MKPAPPVTRIVEFGEDMGYFTAWIDDGVVSAGRIPDLWILPFS
jgi:hypothetical protein